MTKEPTMVAVQSIHYREKKIMELREKRFYATDTKNIDMQIKMYEQEIRELKNTLGGE